MKNMIANNRGQGMVEYLIIVALMAVGAMSVMRVLSGTTYAKFANITAVLQGGQHSAKIEYEKLDESDFRKKDMSDFFRGAKSNKKKRNW